MIDGCPLAIPVILMAVAAWCFLYRAWERAELRRAIRPAPASPAPCLPPLRPLSDLEQQLLADADWDHIWAAFGADDA